MSDVSQGSGWWLASDGKWYPPEPPPPSTQPVEASANPPSAVSRPPERQPAPKRPLTKRLWFWVACGLVVVAIVAVAVLSVNTNKSKGASSPGKSSKIRTTPATTGNVAGATSTTSPPTTVAATEARTLQDVTGSGQEALPQFTVPASAKGWALHYLYDCSSFGGVGNFIVNITGYGASAGTTATGPSEHGISGGSTSYYYHTGAFSLSVDSECKWTVVVQTVPR